MKTLVNNLEMNTTDKNKSAKEILLEKLDIIERSPEMVKQLRKKYVTDFRNIRARIELNLIEPMVVYTIEKIVGWD